MFLALFLYLPSSTHNHILLVLQKCPPCPFLISAGRRASPPLQLFYEYKQQQYIFKKGTAQGLFEIVEVNTHYNTQVKHWTFPTIYWSYMGWLIYQCAWLIKLWSMHKQQTLTTLPNSSNTFINLYHSPTVSSEPVWPMRDGLWFQPHGFSKYFRSGSSWSLMQAMGSMHRYDGMKIGMRPLQWTHRNSVSTSCVLLS